jgi:hypothetical protein
MNILSCCVIHLVLPIAVNIAHVHNDAPVSDQGCHSQTKGKGLI